MSFFFVLVQSRKTLITYIRGYLRVVPLKERFGLKPREEQDYIHTLPPLIVSVEATITAVTDAAGLTVKDNNRSLNVQLKQSGWKNSQNTTQI